MINKNKSIGSIGSVIIVFIGIGCLCGGVDGLLLFGDRIRSVVRNESTPILTLTPTADILTNDPESTSNISPIQPKKKTPNPTATLVRPTQQWTHHIQGEMVYQVTTYNHNVWFASQKGLSHLDLKEGKVTDYHNQNWHNKPLTLRTDKLGQLWVGFIYGTPFASGDQVWAAVTKFDGSPWNNRLSFGYTLPGINYRFPADPPKIAVDTQNNVWVLGQYNELVKYDGTSWHSHSPPDSQRLNLIYSDPQDRLWFGYNEGAIVWEAKRPIQPISGNVIAVAISEDDQRWFGTAENGIIHTSGESINLYTIADGLRSNKILDLSLNSQGNVWIAYQDQAFISQFTDNNLAHYPIPTILVSETIFQVMVDDNDRIWLASDKGLSQFSP